MVRLLFFVLCCTISEAYPSHCLRQHLLTNYDKFVRPVKNQTNSITVAVRLELERISLIEYLQHLGVQTTTYFEWTDEYLKWSPEQYEGLKMVTISSDEIWTPDITLLSVSSAYFALNLFPTTECEINFSGKVICRPSSYYRSHCSIDWRQWPYDVHTCTLWLASWAHPGNLMNTSFSGTGLDISKLEKEKSWELVKADASRLRDAHWPSLAFRFTLRRTEEEHEIRIVVTGLVLCLMTILSWMLPADCGERLTLCVVSLFLHLFCLTYVAYETSFSGNTVPHLVILLRDSLILTALSLMGTVLSQGLYAASRPTPVWLYAVISSRASQILMFPKNNVLQKQGLKEREDGEELKSEPVNTSDDWKLAANLLDRSCLLILCLTYIILFAATIPS